MAFGLGKLAVLESKLDIYEDLSKEMLDKLERAVTTISDNSNKIAIVLERHENRLDEGDKSNTALMQLIKRVEHNLEDLESKVDNLQKAVWTISLSACVVVTILQILPNIGLRLTPIKNPAMILPVSSLANGSN